MAVCRIAEPGLWNLVVPPHYFARVRVKERDFSTFSTCLRVLQKS